MISALDILLRVLMFFDIRNAIRIHHDDGYWILDAGKKRVKINCKKI